MTSTIRGRGLTASVNAFRGAKITSLVDARGVEWLAQADPARTVAPGLAFIDAEMAGWDECAPSIVACKVDGLAVPDHGDLWDIPFAPSGDGLVAIGESLGYRFARRIRPTAHGLRIEYEAEALRGSIPFLWAAHPQFAAPVGSWVSIPAEIVSVVDVLDPALPEVPLTHALASIDSVPAGGSRKWYAPPTTPVHAAAVHRADGSRLELTWSGHGPYLGVWFDNRAFSREPVIAIEPSTGYFDSLERAVAMNRVATLDPGKPLTWSVDLRVVTHADQPSNSVIP